MPSQKQFDSEKRMKEHWYDLYQRTVQERKKWENKYVELAIVFVETLIDLRNSSLENHPNALKVRSDNKSDLIK